MKQKSIKPETIYKTSILLYSVTIKGNGMKIKVSYVRILYVISKSPKKCMGAMGTD